MTRRVLYLLRHGAIERPDDERRYIGQIDLPLAAEGRRQAGQLARRFAGAELGAIFASDLVRSAETAAIIAEAAGLPVRTRTDLREIAMGDWEGCSFRDIAARFPDEFRARGEDLASFRAPGGETFEECSARVVRALYEILASSRGPLLLVGHAGANRLLLCHMLGMPVANLFRIRQDHGCVDVIQCGAAGFQVDLINGPADTGAGADHNGRTGSRSENHGRHLRSHRAHAP